MSRTKPYLKVAAFVPAIVFVVPFIAYRAGAFERFTKPEIQPSVQQVPDEQPPTEQQMFMYSSKSAQVFQPGETTQPPAGDPVFLGGSKSIIIASPPQGGTPTAAPPGANAPKP